MSAGRKHLFAVGPQFAFGNDGGAVSGLARDSSRSLLPASCSIKEGRQCRRTSARWSADPPNGRPLGQILRREALHFNLEIAVRRYLSDEVVREQS